MRMLVVLQLIVFLAIGSSKDIKCRFYEDDWAVIGRLYTCSVEDLIVRLPNENVTNILGVHETEKANKDVKKINVQSQDCEFMPKGFETFFPNIEGLRIAQSGLVSLQQSDLAVFPKLRSVDMFNNDLMSLDADLFALNTHIEYLYFGDNRIRSIGFDILAPLKNLSVAVFQGNTCVSKNFYSKNGETVHGVQRFLNEECNSLRNSIGTDRSFLLSSKQRENMSAMFKEIQLQKEKEREELENLKKPTSDSNVWSLVLVALFLFSASIGAYVLLMKKIRVKRADNESTILPSYNEMTNENFTDDLVASEEIQRV